MMMQLFVLYSRNGQLLSMVCAVFSKKAAMTVRVFTANIPTIVGIYHTFIYSSERVVFLVRVTTQAIFLGDDDDSFRQKRSPFVRAQAYPRLVTLEK